MKRLRSDMKDKPPLAARRPGTSVRRFETLVAMSFAMLLFGLVIVLDQSPGMAAISIGPTDSPALIVVAFLALICLNAAFVAMDTAISMLKLIHVRHVSEKSQRNGEQLSTLLDQRIEYSAACWLGSQLCRLGLVFLCFWISPEVVSWLAPSLGWPQTISSNVLATAILIAPIGLISLIIESVPKSYAGVYPHRVSNRLYRFISLTKILLSPLVLLVTFIANLFTRRFGVKASLTFTNQAEEEIKTIVESAEVSGEIESEEKELLHSVFEFTDTVAREVMTPRVDLDAVPVTMEAQSVMEVIQKSGHSRIPVYEETDDQIIGVVHAKDLLMAMLRGKGRPSLRSLLRPAYFVPENKDLHELLKEMRVNRTQLVVVQDEFGGTAGIVTIEDIVEELVGDIVDEYDVEEPEMVEDADGWLVDGRTHLDDVSTFIQGDLESEEFDTIGGYVFGLFGRQPKQDESIESEGFRFIVAESDGRRIVKLRIESLVEDRDSDSEPQDIVSE